MTQRYQRQGPVESIAAPAKANLTAEDAENAEKLCARSLRPPRSSMRKVGLSRPPWWPRPS